MLHIYTSRASDGSMKSPDKNFATVLAVRRKFLDKSTINPDDTTLMQVTYETDDFCRYFSLLDDSKGDGIVRSPSIESDALVVTQPNHALFLPLADCIGAVIHDPLQNILMVSHLGRHNLVQNGGQKCIDYLVEKHGVDPKNLTVWLSPAAGASNYPLYDFDNRSMHDVAIEQLVAAGIKYETISASPIDVTTYNNYYSHSQFLQGNRDDDGRFAIVAVMD
jgi:copper oxidase (laccase) domain-containing protein